MRIRDPIVAGRFYPAEPERCRRELLELLESSTPASPDGSIPKRIVAGLVPHAGWTFSGGVAARVFRTIATSTSPQVLILIGGVHRYRGRQAAMFGAGRWITPLGPVDIDARLCERILGHTNLIVDDPYAHEDEHSLEVQMPFVKHLFPQAKVVPIMVPPVKTAPEVGQAVARTLSAYNYDAVIIGTTDLTHYGPTYGFTPKGIGAEGNHWAKENDRRFIDLICDVRSTELVAEAAKNKNACNAGAAAATVAAAVDLGATRGILLEHTTSSEVLSLHSRSVQNDSVGYAAVVFG